MDRICTATLDPEFRYPFIASCVFVVELVVYYYSVFADRIVFLLTENTPGVIGF